MRHVQQQLRICYFIFKPFAQTQASGQLANLKKIVPQHAKKDAQILKSKLRKRLASRFPNLLFKILAISQTREGCLLRFGFQIVAAIGKGESRFQSCNLVPIAFAFDCPSGVASPSAQLKEGCLTSDAASSWELHCV